MTAKLERHGFSPEEQALFADKVLVPTEEEQSYCENWGFVLEKYSNGATLIHHPLIDPHYFYSSIRQVYNRGGHADFDAAHIAEHFVAEPVYHIAQRHETTYNQSTWFNWVDTTIKGNSHPDAILEPGGYGIWPVLDANFQAIHDPRSLHSNPEAHIEKQKKILKREGSGDFSKDVMNHGLRVLWKPEHPYFTMFDHAHIDTLTPPDIYKMVNGIYRPDGMIVKLASWGDKQSNDFIRSELSRYINDMPQRETHLPESSPIDFDQTNPGFTPGKYYHRQSSFSDDSDNISLAWAFDAPQFSTTRFALEVLNGHISSALMRFCRDNEIAYQSGSYVNVPSTKGYFICHISPEHISQETAIGYAAAIQEAITQYISPEFIDHIIQMQKQHNRYNPMSPARILEDCVDGLIEYGQIIDSRKVLQLSDNLQVEDYLAVIERLRSVQPAIIHTSG